MLYESNIKGKITVDIGNVPVIFSNHINSKIEYFYISNNHFFKLNYYNFKSQSTIILHERN